VNTPASGVPGDPPPTGHDRRGRPLRTTVTLLAAVCCLAAAIAAGTQAHRELTRKPTATERSAAAAAAVAGRWRSWPVGRIFPVGLGYSTDLLTQETARRVGVSPGTACLAAVDRSLDRLAARAGCRAALRATYLDQLQGVVYTVGVLAFAGGSRAAAFVRGLPRNPARVTGLRAEAFPGTAAAAFDDAARQTANARQDGPYVVLTVAGYADGRPTAVTAERRGSVFAPAAQLAAEIIGPLAAPAEVSCRGPEWSC
jgi:hypothetical protein